jgi:hypothetical protein
MVYGISSKLAKILKAKIRFERAALGDAEAAAMNALSPTGPGPSFSNQGHLRTHREVPELVKTTPYDDFEPLAVELPGDEPVSFFPQHSPGDRSSFESGSDNLATHGNQHSPPRSSHSYSMPPPPPPKDGVLGRHEAVRQDDGDKLVVNAPTPSQYRYAVGMDKIAITSPDEEPRTMPSHHVAPPPTRIEPPPLPPKTPLPEQQEPQRQRTQAPPYPIEDDELPPPVNMARKPDYRVR